MKNRTSGVFGLLGLLVLSLVVAPSSYADDGVIIYRAKGQGTKFSAAKKSLESNYSYPQQAYQGTTIYYGEGTNLNPDVYSSRVVSFYVTFDNPSTVHAGHGYSDVNASKRDARILPRRIRR